MLLAVRGGSSRADVTRWVMSRPWACLCWVENRSLMNRWRHLGLPRHRRNAPPMADRRLCELDRREGEPQLVSHDFREGGKKFFFKSSPKSAEHGRSTQIGGGGGVRIARPKPAGQTLMSRHALSSPSLTLKKKKPVSPFHKTAHFLLKPI